MVAIRDSEISAQSMGINLARYKTMAFAISAGITGLAGALFAHYVRFLAPDAFDILLSIQFVTIVFVGGLGSLHGAIFGAIFVRCCRSDRDRARRPAVRHRPPAGPGAVAVRPGAGAGDPVRAGRHLWPLAEDEALVPASRSSGAPASGGRSLRAVRSGCDEPCFRAEDISIRFGGIRAVDAVSFEVSRARSSPSSARTAPARPRSST